MMVDVDEHFAVGDAFAGAAQALEARTIGGDDAIEFAAAARFLEQTLRIKKSVFLRDRIFVPTNDPLAFIAQRMSEAQLRADAIAVGPDMADNADRFAPAENFENSVNDLGITFHSDFP
jgi:hypothetical protein